MEIFSEHISLGYVGRNGEEHWESLLPSDTQFWIEALDKIKTRQYCHDGCDVTIEANWSSVPRRLKKNYKEFHELYFGDRKTVKLTKNKIKVPVSISVSGENELSTYGWYPNFFVEHYCYEIFTVMNLALPGSCDFFSLSIPDNFRGREKLNLSSIIFEFALEDSLRGAFPTLKELPLEEVISWYSQLNIGLKQKAESPIEKVLFSLYHLCKSDGDISDVIWVAHALEAMFSTKVGEGFTNLINRITFVLNLDKKQKSILKKQLRKLYDLRSSLVHGGYKVYHPMRREVIETSLNDQYSELTRNIQFGMAIILACIQVFISKGWFGITVEESVFGVVQP